MFRNTREYSKLQGPSEEIKVYKHIFRTTGDYNEDQEDS